MTQLPPEQRTAYGTFLYFVEAGAFENFMRDYQRILIDNFQKVRIKCRGKYYSCDQEHDPRNWNRKTWHHLDLLCRKQRLDHFALRDTLFEHLGRKLDCECQVLYDDEGIAEGSPMEAIWG
jgi:hypothetical protein